MSIHRDKERGCYVFEFSRRVAGQRIRTRKSLPKTWNRAQAESYDRTQTAKLYAVVSHVGPEPDIDDAVAAYLNGRVPDLKSGKDVARELALIAPFYQGRPLSALPDVCKAITIKGKGNADGEGKLAPATIKKRIRYLSAACRWAWKHLHMGDHDPAARVTVPTVRNERNVTIDRKGMLQLCRRCPHKPTRALIRIAFYSGMRLGEIERAQVLDGRFVLRDTKNGEPRMVPVHPRLRVCLKYPRQTRYMTHYHFFKARKAFGMPELHFHDLRHSCATSMIDANVDLHTIGAVLGHKSAASMKRYAHQSTVRQEAAILRIGKRA